MPIARAQDRLDTRRVQQIHGRLEARGHSLPHQAPPLVSLLKALPWADWPMTPELHQPTHIEGTQSPRWTSMQDQFDCQDALLLFARLSVSLLLGLKRKE